MSVKASTWKQVIAFYKRSRIPAYVVSGMASGPCRHRNLLNEATRCSHTKATMKHECLGIGNVVKEMLTRVACSRHGDGTTDSVPLAGLECCQRSGASVSAVRS